MILKVGNRVFIKEYIDLDKSSEFKYIKEWPFWGKSGRLVHKIVNKFSTGNVYKYKVLMDDSDIIVTLNDESIDISRMRNERIDSILSN